MKAILWLTMAVSPALAGLEPGDGVNVSLRGVEAVEQEKVNGTYRVGESGGVMLPLLDQPVAAKGLTGEQFARAAENAYKAAGIYTKPRLVVEVLQGGEAPGAGPSIISVGGHVKRAGESDFRKGMTLIQAVDAAGGRDAFGSRNVMLIRGGKEYCLDFLNLKHKNIALLPGDSLQVEQKGVIDRWKGSEKALKPLFD